MAPSIWLDGFLAARVLAPSGAGREALYAAAAERFRNAGDEQEAEPLGGFMTSRYEELLSEYGESRTVASMFLTADDLGMTVRARGFAQAVRIMKSAWPTEWFVAGERRMVSLLARLEEGGLSNLDECADVVTFIHCDGRSSTGAGGNDDMAMLRPAGITEGHARQEASIGTQATRRTFTGRGSRRREAWDVFSHMQAANSHRRRRTC